MLASLNGWFSGNSYLLCVYIAIRVTVLWLSLSLTSLVINQDCTVVDSYFRFPLPEVSNEEWCLYFFTSTSPHLMNTWTSPIDKQPAPGKKCHRWKMWLWSLASMKLALWHFSICHHQSFSVKVLFVLSLLLFISHYVSSPAFAGWRLYLLSPLLTVGQKAILMGNRGQCCRSKEAIKKEDREEVVSEFQMLLQSLLSQSSFPAQ